MNARAEPGTPSRNDLLTQSGHGTPGGALLRRFWQPVYLSKLLRDEPVALTILHEDLVLFRSEDGVPGLLARRCPHRNADLSYGRLEDGGLRCPYHGWLFSVKGACLEQPNIFGGPKIGESHNQKAYPVIERGGLIWAYMGSGEAPALPDYPFFDLPAENVFIGRWYSACNHLQGLEGNIDPSHTSFLHYVKREKDELFLSALAFQADKAPRIAVDETSYGIRVYAERIMPGVTTKTLRISNFILPNAASANGPESQLGLGGATMLWHVPINDREHWRIEVSFHANHPLPDLEKMLNAELDAHGERSRVKRNRYLQDRREMEDKSFLGMGPAFPIHDLFVTESMGEITDHSTEHLVSSDLAIARTRRMILDAISEIEAGREPKRLTSVERLHMRDFLTITHELPLDADIAQFADELVRKNIYNRAR